jgi:hypothetical protein
MPSPDFARLAPAAEEDDPPSKFRFSCHENLLAGALFISWQNNWSMDIPS